MAVRAANAGSRFVEIIGFPRCRDGVHVRNGDLVVCSLTQVLLTSEYTVLAAMPARL